MIIGLPKGLYYYKYHRFMTTFLDNLNISYITSPYTNKNIVNEGIKTCVDEACLPVKIFHGHVSYLKDKSDFIIVPRIMKEWDGEYICPKFCGLPEMVQNSIDKLPDITTIPLSLDDTSSIYTWCKKIAKRDGKKAKAIDNAIKYAMAEYKVFDQGYDDKHYPYKVGLLGHCYCVHDNHFNMDIVKLLHALKVGIITEEKIGAYYKEASLKYLVKKPFWTSMKNILGAGIFMAKSQSVDGIIFLSSFQCGIDSVSIDLLKDIIGDFPLLILKLDEHSGQAGMETRVEAFLDMLKRRERIDTHISTHG